MLGMHGCYAANKAISEADLVIAVGARFSDRVALNPNKFASKAKNHPDSILTPVNWARMWMWIWHWQAMLPISCKPSCRMSKDRT